ncbi:MAG: lipid-A-disaccharide synthase [Bacteroidia bacterium]|nr:lipid-A-disaccharide synthase [Bacteroidia bacterium]
MKYFLIAGEASGDLHGANLIKAIKQKDDSAEFNYWGGDLMQAEANGLLMHYKKVNIMGFVEVVLNLSTILKNINTCKQQIEAFNPDVVILIDYPGFNLRIAEFCKSKNIKTAYYIAPKIWAWKENRGKKLERFIDELLLIFPFEVPYFKKWKVKSTYVGNPLLDAIANHQPDEKFKLEYVTNNKPIIALLPGSRKQEINRILPLMMQVITKFSNYQFIIGGAPGLDPEFYTPFLNQQVKVVFGKTYDLMLHAQGAIVCSGTATLETALFNVPQVCGYVANPISYKIARLLVKNIKYISLVNLCLDRPAITELLQNEFTINNVTNELNAVLKGGDKHNMLMADYTQLKQDLGGIGASANAANIVYNLALK